MTAQVYDKSNLFLLRCANNLAGLEDEVLEEALEQFDPSIHVRLLQRIRMIRMGRRMNRANKPERD